MNPPPLFPSIPGSLAGYDSNPITFTLTNAYNNQPTIFVTNNAALNEITITLTNNTSGPITLTGGDSTFDPSEASSNNWTCIYLQFGGVFSNPDVQNMKLAYPGWNPGQFPDNNIQTLAIAPPTGTTLVIPSGGQLELSLLGVTPTSGSSGGHTIGFEYVNISGAGQNPGIPGFDQTLIQVASPPNAPNLPLQASFQGLGVVTTGSNPTNALQFAIVNPMQTAVVPGGGASWGDLTPTFTFSFIAGTDAGSISDQIGSATLNVVEDQTNGWPNPSHTPGTSTWSLLVDSTPGTVIGTGDESFVVLALTGLEVDALPGITAMMITWSSIPSYSDGQIILPIVKVSPTSVDSFTVTINGTDYTYTSESTPPSPPTIDQPAGPTPITFSYSASYCTFVVITNTNYATIIVGGNSIVTGIAATIEYTTTYTLTAVNYITGQQASLSITVTVTPNLFALFPKQTIIMWSGDPANPPAGWVLCAGGTMPDGQTPIPDLTDRFVVGVGPIISNNTMNATGGTSSHTHDLVIPANSLLVESSGTEDGAHAHTMKFNTTMQVASGDSSHYMVMYGNSSTTSYPSDTQNSPYEPNTDTDGVHGHNVPQADTPFTTASAQNLPPWYSLAFIIKVF